VARMIPHLNEEQLRSFRSRAEARFYEVCRNQLPEELLVIYSTKWLYRDNQGRVNEGEADFTLVLPTLGVLAVEVKGGGVTFDPAEGVWQSVDRYGNVNVIKDPFLQASKERHALIDQVGGSQAWRQADIGRVTFGHAVVFPDLQEATPLLGPDRAREIIGINSDMEDLAQWVVRAMRYWRQPGDAQPSMRGLRIIEGILCKPIDVRPVLRAVIDDAEAQRIRLTQNQAKVLRIIAGRRRAVVSGGAGTGKTLIAVEKAKQLAEQGLSVLLLCYNRPLADSLALGLRDTPMITVQGYHQFCERRVRQATAVGRNLLAEAAEAYPGGGDQHRFDVQLPFALALSAEVLDERFDAVVVDEAQDFSDEYWFGVELLLRDQERSHLYLFIDENQTLYPRRANVPVNDEPFYLTANCRNTAPIHETAYRFYKGNEVDLPDLPGPAVNWTAIDGDDAQADAVARRVHQWTSVERIDVKDIAVLVVKRPKSVQYELLQARETLAGVRWAFEVHGQTTSVLLETVARFKGLETQAVVLWLGDEVLDGEMWESVYVGTTRAKSLLAVVGSARVIKAVRGR
jgi:hypothetical protein